MGFYVNPPNEEKESFMIREGECVTVPPSYDAIPCTHAAVCVVDNGLFNAAGIINSEDELYAFTDQNDHRRKQWFLIEREKLFGVSNVTANDFD